MNDEILVRYLQKETNEDENIYVENWIEESQENKKTVEQLYFVLEANDTLRVLQSVDSDQALAQFKQNLKNKDRQALKTRLFHTLQRAAAILFLPALTLSLYLYLSPSSTVNKAEMVEMKTNSGMVSSFALPDGSKVWLNSNSRIRYPSFFQGKNREVEVSGQAYFEVVKNSEQPFIVQTKDKYSVKVLGTTFSMAAYDHEDIIETTLESGSVEIYTPRSSQPKALVPNERAVFSKLDNKLQVFTINSEYDTVWRNGEIRFKNHPMEHVLRVLSRQYNVSFDVRNKRILESKITASFDNEHLPQILEYLGLASDIKFKIEPVQTTNDNVHKTVVRVSR